MDPGGGVQQSHDEVQSGHSDFFFTFKYILTFQAGLTVIEVPFKEEPEDDKPEPLRMEHFYLPLGMWMIGILLSVLGFIAEIIIHRRRKSHQMSPESEDNHNSYVEEIEDIKI